jgi:hypothetical protein
MDTNICAAAVYFDFDSSVVKSSEQRRSVRWPRSSKPNRPTSCSLTGIAMSAAPRSTTGHSANDALALRDSLIGLGIAAERIRTRTWGEDVPACGP